jgi:hypothetical protein
MATVYQPMPLLPHGQAVFHTFLLLVDHLGVKCEVHRMMYSLVRGLALTLPTVACTRGVLRQSVTMYPCGMTSISDLSMMVVAT